MPSSRSRTLSLDSAPPLGTELMLPPRGITFAPNVDAETYGAPPPLIEPPPSTLFPVSSDDSVAAAATDPITSSPRRTSHARKKPDDWIPRPPNAFILFRSEFIKSQHVPGDVEANHGNLSKIIGLCWRNLPFPERSVWEHKARLAQAAHKAQYPHYRFRPHAKSAPSATGASPPRRRVKEPPKPPDARRVADIAGLLVEGVKGARLARAVRRLDEERMGRGEMRFDEPVTAEWFGERGRKRERCRGAAAESVEDGGGAQGEGESVLLPQTPSPPPSPASPVSVVSQGASPDPGPELECAPEPLLPPFFARECEAEGAEHEAFALASWAARDDAGMLWSATHADADAGMAAPAPASASAPSPWASSLYTTPLSLPFPYTTQMQMQTTTANMGVPSETYSPPTPPELDLAVLTSASTPVDTPQRSPTLAHAFAGVGVWGEGWGGDGVPYSYDGGMGMGMGVGVGVDGCVWYGQEGAEMGMGHGGMEMEMEMGVGGGGGGGCFGF